MTSPTNRMSFLFTNWEGGGNLTPSIQAARKLQERGHFVRFMGEECNRAEAEGVGATFIPWKRALNRKDRCRDSQTFRDWAEATPQDDTETDAPVAKTASRQTASLSVMSDASEMHAACRG